MKHYIKPRKHWKSTRKSLENPKANGSILKLKAADHGPAFSHPQGEKVWEVKASWAVSGQTNANTNHLKHLETIRLNAQNPIRVPRIIASFLIDLAFWHRKQLVTISLPSHLPFVDRKSDPAIGKPVEFSLRRSQEAQIGHSSIHDDHRNLVAA